MLEDVSTQSIVCWGSKGDSFIVKDINEFSMTVLPRIFNHSNFASFVRQLNKYDFHKVKQTDSHLVGEKTCIFRHPDFHADRPEDLQNIKRKLTNMKPWTSSLLSNDAYYAPGASSPPPYMTASNSDSDQRHSRTHNVTPPLALRASMNTEIEQIREESESLRARVRNLEEGYETMRTGLQGMKRAIALHAAQMQGLANRLASVSR
ncbi:hypothetical protein GALMADRAFT_439138 [Galerina marginata CBS 339.88]|uniref:HSF-type DNA-binding domain-containing protein n=1 Tax=Galerina marginata (strain CBS 339.88) TaxID=685588 RepID=A0A067TBK8_GALM3|nr:hypothetical protein GALMADRAFT_439138 [Galerina marginata CBS 339.88]